MNVRVAILVAVVALGCKRAAPTITRDDAAPPPPSLLSRYPIRKHLAWNEHRERANKLTVVQREELWTPDNDGWLVRTVTLDGEPFERGAFIRRYVINNDGLAYESMQLSDDAAVMKIAPPKLVLPASSRAWSTEHVLGSGGKQGRRCEVTPFTGCADGIIVSCTNTTEGLEQYVERTRYCGGVGKVGFEELIGNTERRWSEDLRDVPP